MSKCRHRWWCRHHHLGRTGHLQVTQRPGCKLQAGAKDARMLLEHVLPCFTSLSEQDHRLHRICFCAASCLARALLLSLHSQQHTWPQLGSLLYHRDVDKSHHMRMLGRPLPQTQQGATVSPVQRPVDSPCDAVFLFFCLFVLSCFFWYWLYGDIILTF